MSYMETGKYTTLVERGRSAFQQAESEKFTDTTVAAAYYVIASKCFIAAAELIDNEEVDLCNRHKFLISLLLILTFVLFRRGIHWHIWERPCSLMLRYTIS